ncbi:unnamed protein product [Medioppia subpectinata]|uniref:Uncharacterized protein n=1 Tax=Medioppia subpectinata TaxID=1979941 RepID=A0A7R9Q1Z4_9ACAR|nr:unnamed protein product [Medioppia subpectinata]CAG2109762.1 unnamed protein product [Medioppia subpectinata]
MVIVLPICAAVDVEVRNIVGNAIKRVEILGCTAEPCTLTLGKPINVSITFQADFEVPEDSPTIETFINLWTDYYRYDPQYAVTNYDEKRDVVLKSTYTVVKTIWICTDKVYYEYNDPDQSAPNYGTPLGIRDVVFQLTDHGWYYKNKNR